MEHLEEQLRKALRRRQPSPEFTARVLRRAEEPEGREPRRWWNSLVLRWAMAGLLAAAGLGGWIYHEQEQRRMEGEAARRQAMMALQIAGAKLRLAQDKVQSLSRQ